MKTLFLFLALAFLVYAKANPDREPAAESEETIQSVAQGAGENGPADDADAAQRGVPDTCYKGRGYCFPRAYRCRSGYKFKEHLNSCPYKRAYQCCVP